MNELFSLDLSNNKMQEIGLSLGADVPAAFCNEVLIARGIGEKIEKINSKIKYYIIIIKPDFSCNTKEMYNKLDNTSEIKQKYNSENIKNAIINKNIEILAENLYNVFENNIDEIEILKKRLLKEGALGALMTGSGSCIYGIFKDKLQAKVAYNNLKKEYDTYFCITR